MSVWFKYADDKDITIGHPNGASIFKKPISASCPSAGYSGITLFGEIYPIAQGGGYFYFSPTASQIPNEICDVPVNHDGSCGTYNDWANLSNVTYATNGTLFYTADVNQPSISTTEVPSGSTVYLPNGFVDVGYKHDGSGGYYAEEVNFSYWADGTDTGQVAVEETQVPSGGDAYGTGRYQRYLWDGSGGYYAEASYSGTYHPADQVVFENITGTGNSTEVPSGSSNYFDNQYTGDRYTWNGSGGYNYYTSWYKPYGTYITDDGVDYYYWAGDGSYYVTGL